MAQLKGTTINGDLKVCGGTIYGNIDGTINYATYIGAKNKCYSYDNISNISTTAFTASKNASDAQTRVGNIEGYFATVGDSKVLKIANGGTGMKINEDCFNDKFYEYNYNYFPAFCLKGDYITCQIECDLIRYTVKQFPENEYDWCSITDDCYPYTVLSKEPGSTNEYLGVGTKICIPANVFYFNNLFRDEPGYSGTLVSWTINGGLSKYGIDVSMPTDSSYIELQNVTEEFIVFELKEEFYVDDYQQVPGIVCTTIMWPHNNKAT